MSEIVTAIETAVPESTGLISHEDTLLPFPDEVDARSLNDLIGASTDTPLLDGVADTIRRFTDLIERGMVSPPGSQVTPLVS